MIKPLTLLSCIALLTACGNSTAESEATNGSQEQEQNMPATSHVANKGNNQQVTEKRYTAEVKHFKMEGGFYGLVTKNGKHFLPMNLAKEFQQDGAVIEFSGAAITDVMTLQQWGTPFKLNEVKLIKAGKKTSNPHL